MRTYNVVFSVLGPTKCRWIIQ